MKTVSPVSSSSFDAVELSEDDFAPIDSLADVRASLGMPPAEESEPEGVSLSEAHAEYLASEGISREAAEAHGTYSVAAAADLPVALRRFFDGQGLTFFHTKPSGDRVPQYRPDAPTKTGKNGKPVKYYLPKGCGNSFYVSPLQAHLIGVAEEVWIIEGTKGGLSVLTTLMAAGQLDSVLLVFVTGVWGGLEGGVHSPMLLELIKRGAKVTAFFDADVDKNAAVWDASDLLQRSVAAGSAGMTRLSFAKVPLTGSGGVSDYLGTLRVLTPEERLASLRFLASDEEAVRKLPRRPAVAKQSARQVVTVADPTVSASGAKVFKDLEVIARTMPNEKGELAAAEKLVDGAAIWLTAVHEIFDDLTQTALRTGEFDVAIKIGGKVTYLKKVTSAMLDDPRRLLSQVPGGAGETVTIRPKCEQEIGEAIRASAGRAGAELPVVRRLKRCGWFGQEEIGADGVSRLVHRYVSGNLAIGPRDTSYELAGEIDEPSMAGFEIGDPWEISKDSMVEAAREVLRVGDELLVDKTPYLVGMGFLHAVGAGQGSIGGEIIVGPIGSGKTHLAHAVLSMQNGGWPGMSNFEGTPNFVAGVGKGVQHATVGVDDLRDRSKGNHRSVDTQMEAFEAIMRRIYGGGEYAKGRQYFDKARGEVRSRAKDANSPGFILTAEPAAMPDGHNNSNLERGLFIGVTEASTFVPGGADEVEDMARSGVLHAAYTGFLRWVAAQIEGRKTAEDRSMAAWDAEVKRLLTSCADDLRAARPGLPKSRTYRVAGNALGGYLLFLYYARAIGAIDSDRFDALVSEAIDLVGTAMVTCWETFQGGGSHRSALDGLISAVFSGDYWIEGITEPYGEGVGVRRGKLGWVGETADENVVFIDTKAAETITGLKGKALGAALEPHLVTSKGTYMRKVRTGAGSVYVYAVKASSWGASKHGETVHRPDEDEVEAAA